MELFHKMKFCAEMRQETSLESAKVVHQFDPHTGHENSPDDSSLWKCVAVPRASSLPFSIPVSVLSIQCASLVLSD